MSQKWNATGTAGDQWVQTLTFTNNGAPIDLAGLTWSFVIRPDVEDKTSPALVTVTTTTTAQGQITVVPLTGTMTITLTPAATALLGKDTWALALRANPGLATQTLWADGAFTSRLVAAP